MAFLAYVEISINLFYLKPENKVTVLVWLIGKKSKQSSFRYDDKRVVTYVFL